MYTRYSYVWLESTPGTTALKRRKKKRNAENNATNKYLKTISINIEHETYGNSKNRANCFGSCCGKRTATNKRHCSGKLHGHFRFGSFKPTTATVKICKRRHVCVYVFFVAISSVLLFCKWNDCYVCCRRPCYPVPVQFMGLACVCECVYPLMRMKLQKMGITCTMYVWIN